MPPAERADIYRFSAMPKKEFEAAFIGLLVKMQITALSNGRVLNENWSTLRYGSARAWEALAETAPAEPADPRAAAVAYLSPALCEADIKKLIG